jgi:hypothetical protein
MLLGETIMKVIEKVLLFILFITIILTSCFIGYKWSEYKLEMLYGIEDPEPKLILIDMMR